MALFPLRPVSEGKAGVHLRAGSSGAGPFPSGHRLPVHRGTYTLCSVQGLVLTVVGAATQPGRPEEGSRGESWSQRGH